MIVLNEGAKNLHLEHIEDEIFNTGVEGGRGAINFILSLSKMLSSGTKSSTNVTVKWDGAPAVFCGEHPETGEFVVAKKGIFAKKQEYYTTHAEIDEKLSGDLAEKFHICLDYLSKLGIKGKILQGDLMFTKKDIKKEKINKESFITFQPNTILYAVPSTSKLARTMKAAQLGIVFHTTYTGGTLEDMSASFGADLSGLKKTKNVWMDDAEYNDVSGTATFTQKDSAEILRLMSRTGKVFSKIKSAQLNKFLEYQKSMPSGATYKTYHNSKVREGSNLLRLNYKKHADGYFKFAQTKLQKEVDGMKSEKGKKAKEKNMNTYLTSIRKDTNLLKTLVEFQALINYAKTKILYKVNQAKQLTDTFVKTDDGFDVVAPEGFVAIDNNLGGAVKLVDRMEFSFNNFTAAKAWDK
tara:strand:- start:2085 stop:3314 length:1230 start_codon:yes stop_codon:yes gene_type:complete